MVYDNFDKIISAVLQSLRSDFSLIIDSMLSENQQKFTDMHMAIQSMQEENQHGLARQQHHYEQLIEEIVHRSLYVTDTINELQKRGVINFEAEVRRINEDVEMPEVEVTS